MEFAGWKRILVPTDLTPFAEQAVRYAHRLAEQLGAELHVLHVAADAAALAARMPATGVLEPAGPGDGRDDYHRWLADLLGESGTVRRVEAVRVGADIAEAVRHYAADQGADLIVMASHGRGGLHHLILGSTAERVLRLPGCPVLVLRPEAV